MLDERLSTPLLHVNVFRHRGHVIITVDEDSDYKNTEQKQESVERYNI